MLKNEKLIHRLTLEQKIGLIVSNKKYVREQISDYEFPTFTLQENANQYVNGISTVVFPSNRTIAKSWNKELIKNVYNALGTECTRISSEMIFKADTSINPNFIDDQFLLGNFITQQVKGIEGSKATVILEKSNKNNNYELSMLANDIAIRDSKVSYALINNADEARYLMQIDHYDKEIIGNTSNPEVATQLISLGATMIFFNGDYEDVVDYLKNAINTYPEKYQALRNNEINLAQFNMLIEEGKIIAIDTIDNACDKMIGLFQKVGEFRNKININKYSTEESIKRDVKRFEEIAKEASREGIVLLKNNDNALPLTHEQRVAFIGEPFKDTDYLKSLMFTEPTEFKSGFDLVNDYEDITYTGFAHGYLINGETSLDIINKSVRLAQDSDKVVLYLEAATGETKLRNNQLQLLEKIKNTGKQIIVCLLTDHYIELDFADMCDAILYCESLGQYTHEAILDILAGKCDTTGRLTSEYPASFDDEEFDAKDIPTYCYNKPYLYPFGYGLSYAKYELSNISVTKSDVCFTVTNVSDNNGIFIPQLYINKQDSNNSLRNVLLKGYTRIKVQSHETIKVRIPFDEMTFRYLDQENGTYGYEAGQYNIYVGVNAEDIRLQGVADVSQYRDIKHGFEDELEQNELDEANMVDFIKNTKQRKLSKKAKYIINTLLLVYFTASLILLLVLGDSGLAVSLTFGFITLFVDAFLIYRFFLIHKITEEKEVSDDENMTLTMMIDKVKCFNPVATYKYDEYGHQTESIKAEGEPELVEEEQNEESTEEMVENEIIDDNEEVEEETISQGEENTIEVEDAAEIIKAEEEKQAKEKALQKALGKMDFNRIAAFEDADKTPLNFNNKISMNKLVEDFVRYARMNGLGIEINSARTLFSALAATKMVFITTNLKDKLDELLSIINSFFGSKASIVTASPEWNTVNDLIWYKDENDKYVKTSFIKDLHKANELKNNFNLAIFKNVEMKNFESYFKKCIDFAKNPTRTISFDVFKQLKVSIPSNMHFIVCPTNNNYINNLSLDIVNSSMFVDVLIQESTMKQEMLEKMSYVSNSMFETLVRNCSKNQYLGELSWKKIDELVEEISKSEEIEISNKSVLQIERYSGVYKECGGDEVELLDCVLANKIIPQIKLCDFVKSEEGYKLVRELLERIFAPENVKRALNVLTIRGTNK